MDEQEYTVLDKLCRNVFQKQLLSYFILDRSGGIIRWGGNLTDLNIEVPEQGSRISDVVIFMEGILPLKNKTLSFSCIKTDTGCSMDALLFRTKQGYGLIIWDAAEKEALLSRTQQQCNELSLLIEEQKNQIIEGKNKRIHFTNQNFIEDLFLSLNYAVLEMNEQGHFILLGTPPMWVSQLPQSSRLLSGMTCGEDVFTFLGNFIQEAKERWRKNPGESFKSGIWIEKDHTGQEFLFEATGISVQGKKLLIITNDVCDPLEKQTLIQKGRDLALHYHELQRSDLELRNMHDQLEERVKERTKDLELANHHLANELKERKRIEKEQEEVARQLRQSRKMEAIGTLAGGIAHDFNNILAAIMGFTELSMTEVDDQSPVKKKLKKILHASERAKDLVRQILTFSHQTEFEKKPLELGRVVKDTLKLLRASLPAFIEIKLDIRSTAYIMADPTQIHQVIMNLCTNAMHAMNSEGGTLFIRVTEMDIKPDDIATMPELSPGLHVVLGIKDTGSGISHSLMDRIFDPYFTTKDKNKGTGLGLSVVHGIVANSNGHIQVFSREDKGSEFNIILPAFDTSEEVVSPQKTMPFGNNEHILFVDDEIFQTELAEELLTRLGYRTTACEDPEKALELFKSKQSDFHLLITDMIMPKMSGKTLAEKIHKLRPDLPIILCSGYSETINTQTLRYSGVSQYLLKPVGMESLAYAIRNALL